MGEDQNLEQERRAIRHKRRVHNQIWAFIAVCVFCILVLAGVFFIGKNLIQSHDEQEKQEEVIEQMLEEEKAENQEVILSEPEPVEPELTPEEKLNQIVEETVSGMSLEEKVAGLFIVTPEELTGAGTAVKAGDSTKEALEKYPVGGLIYFSKNIQTEEQISEMISNSLTYNKYPMFIGVDEEGGEVSRVSEKTDVGKIKSPAEVAATNDVTEAYRTGSSIAIYLRRMGFNLDFAPVSDVAEKNSVLGNRSYGSDAALVGEFSVNMINGLQDGGISSCMKHFPGLGSAAKDTHEGMVTTDQTLDDFRAKDFEVYKKGISAGVDFIMVSHLSVPSVTGDNTPSSLSPAVVTDLLRKELGYDGIVISDSLSMKAVTEYYSSEEAAVLALRAGNDMILMPENFGEAYQGILTAVQEGTIAPERIDDALKRIYRVKLRGQTDTGEVPAGA